MHCESIIRNGFVCLAGYFGLSAMWEQFRYQWTTVTYKHRLPHGYLHAAEFFAAMFRWVQ